MNTGIAAGFQTKVIDPRTAYVGDSVGENEYRSKSYIANTDIVVGRFAFQDLDNDPTGFSICQTKGKANKLVGLVARSNQNSQPFEAINDGYSMLIPAHQNVEIFARGERFATRPDMAIAIDNKVYASNTDGSIIVGDGSAKAGYTLTNYRVTEIRADLIAISNVENVEV